MVEAGVIALYDGEHLKQDGMRNTLIDNELK